MPRKKRRTRKLNGAGSITKLTGNRSKPWMVRVPAQLQIDGTMKREVLGYYTTSEEAEIALAKYKINPFDVDEKNTTFADLYDIFLENKKQEVTAATYRNLNNIYLTHFTSIKIRTIRSIRFLELQNLLDKLPKHTSARAKSIITGVYKIAMKNNIIDKDISTLLETTDRLTNTLNRDIFTADVIKKIRKLSTTHEDEKIRIICDMILILLYSGMRTIEIRQIETVNINLEENYMIGGSKTEAGRDRIIPIHYKVKDIVLKHYNLSNKYLFNGVNNKPFGEDRFKKSFREMRKIIGFEQTAYSTRHTFITALQKLNVTEEKIKKIVGHKTSDITSGVYTHYNASDFHNMIKDLDYGD